MRDLLATRNDDYLSRAYDYRQLLLRFPDQLHRAARRFPDIAAAEKLNEDAVTVQQLKILVIGNRDPAHIARYLRIDIEVVNAWEALFFDVRAAREAVGFISHHVIRPEQEHGNWEFAKRLQVAYMAPSAAFVVARFVPDDPIEQVLPVTACERLIERRIQLAAKLDAALAICCTTEAGGLRFIKIYLTAEIQRQRIQLQGLRLAEQCREAERKHEIRKLREERHRRRDQQLHEQRQYRARLKAEFEAQRAARRFRLREQQLDRARQTFEQQQTEKAAAANRHAERKYRASVESLAKAVEAIVPASEIERRRRRRVKRARAVSATAISSFASRKARSKRRHKASVMLEKNHPNSGGRT